MTAKIVFRNKESEINLGKGQTFEAYPTREGRFQHTSSEIVIKAMGPTRGFRVLYFWATGGMGGNENELIRKGKIIQINDDVFVQAT